MTDNTGKSGTAQLREAGFMGGNRSGSVLVCVVLLLALAAPSTGSAADTATDAPRPVEAIAPREYAIGFLPGGDLFKALIADPRWPHFALAYQGYIDNQKLASVAAVSFGESFMIYRDTIGKGMWETGIQAGVYSFFDLDTPSKDLVNTDYIVGIVVGYRRDKFSTLCRLFHQSSHLGDEYIFSNRVKNRVNLSYESVDLRLSYEFLGDALRLYAGGGYIFERQPVTLKPLSLQSGLELRSPWPGPGPGPGPGAKFRPIAAADIQYREENNWRGDVSLRAGIEFQRWLGSRNLQILLEYFTGHSPNGQFYTDKIEYLGLGLHFNF